MVVKTGTGEEGEDKADVVDMEEELQNEVGALWDMTINVVSNSVMHLMYKST